MNSGVETSWAIKFKDLVTGPLKRLTGHTDKLTNATDKAAATTQKLADKAQKASNTTNKLNASGKKSAESLIDRQKSLQNQLDRTENKMEQLVSQIREINRVSGNLKLDEELEKTALKADKLRKELDKVNASLAKSGKSKNLGMATIIGNQASELTGKLLGAFDFAASFSDARTEIKRMTDLAGSDLDQFARRSYKMAKIFNKDGRDVSLAINVMAKAWNVSYKEAFDQMQRGFEVGADTNGEMLDQMKEYPHLMKDAGISMSQFIDLMSVAQKKGIYMDKAVDAVKEGTISLQNLTKSQMETLNNIGIDQSTIKGKSPWEAMLTISDKLKGKTREQIQRVVSDIFRGAGEDAKPVITEMLANGLDPGEPIKQAGSSIRGFLADVQSWFGTTFASISQYIAPLTPLIQATAGMIPIIGSLSSGGAILSKVMTGVGVAFRFMTGPIGIAITIIGLLVAGVKYAWNNFEGFRKFLFSMWETVKVVFNGIWEIFKAVFQPIGDTIKAIIEGRWMDAAKSMLSYINPIDTIKRIFKATSGITDAIASGWGAGQKKGEESWRKSQEKPKNIKEKSTYSNVPGLSGNIVDDGKKDKSKSKGTASGGLEIGGNKSIVMNLEIKNIFNMSGKMDIKRVAEEVTGHITDKLKDALLTTG